MASLQATMLHALIKARAEKLHHAMLAAETLADKVDTYRKGTALAVGKLILGDCRVEEAELGGRPAAWITHDQYPSDRAVLFLHGGGYIGGTVEYSHNQMADIAKTAGLKVVGLEYRLAPENPFPAAVEDVLAAWRDLLAAGFAANNLTFLGFSAGGGLALAGVLAMKKAGLPLPGAVVGLSPWCDLTLRQATIRANKDKDIMLSPEFLKAAAELYAAGHDRTDPLISPIYGDFTGFPPLLLQVAAEELLLGETIAVANKAEHSGVATSLEIYDGMWHVWQSLDELVPESRIALDKIADFINRRNRPE